MKSATYRHNKPAMSGLVGPGSDATTGAGRAIIGETVAWRVRAKKTGEVFARSNDGQ